MRQITKDALSWPSVEAYINRRIDALHLEIESAPAERVPAIQGSIQELRLMVIQADRDNNITTPEKRAPSAY